jgi:hypothetical protein
MADEKLLDYVRRQIRAGYAPEQIKIVLLRQGWYESEINDAVNMVLSSVTSPNKAPSPQQPEKMGFLKKIDKVLFSPSEFFENVRWEEGVKGALRYLIILSLIQFLIFVAVLFLIPSVGMILGLQSIGSMLMLPDYLLFILYPALILLGNIIGYFIIAGFTHIFALILGAKKGYSSTYKAVVYSATPGLLLWWIPFIGFLFFWWIILVGVLFFFWTLFLEIRGLSKLHDISMGRAFLIVILPIIIVAVIVAVLLLLILTAIFVAIGGFLPLLQSGNFSIG